MSDDDYLSANFIPEPTSDVRPGLQFSASSKRKINISKKAEQSNKRNRIKPIKVLEAERRDEALKKELPEDNKGFAMMRRMGYKPGTAIGKKEGIATAPISVSLKNDRSGLGKKEEDQEKVKLMLEQEIENHKHKIQNSKQLLIDYQENVRKERMNKRVLGDIRRSQKACEQLDRELGETEPQEIWYWPELPKETNEDESDEEIDESDEPEPEEKLLILTVYLRKKHLYCIWCGVKFNDSDDLTENCPGNTYDDHE